MDALASVPDFWTDQRAAQKVGREAESLRDELATWNGVLRRTDDLLELGELAQESGDDEMTAGIDSEFTQLEKDYERLRTSLMFSGAYDQSAAILTISPMKHNWAVKFLSHGLYADEAEFLAALRNGDVARKIEAVRAGS